METEHVTSTVYIVYNFLGFIKIKKKKKKKKKKLHTVQYRAGYQCKCDLFQELVVVSALDGRCVHFESPVLDVSKWLITLLRVSFLNNFNPKT